MPHTVNLLAEHGVRVLNVTVSLPLADERLYAACAAAGVRVNRVIFSRNCKVHWEAETDGRRQLDIALPFCEQYGVQIGVQHHCSTSMPVNAMGLQNLVRNYDPAYVGAIWGAAHCVLEGTEPEPVLEVVASHMGRYFTSGRQGYSSWKLGPTNSSRCLYWVALLFG